LKVIERVDLPHRAARVDQEKFQHVVDRAHRSALAIAFDPHVLAEIVQQRLQRRHRASGQEVPFEGRVRNQTAREAAQLLGRIVGRIEADVDEAHLRPQVRVGDDPVAQTGHQAGCERAPQRIGAVRIEKRQQRDLAAGQLREPAPMCR
jgi:hypothetical protein